MGAGLRIECGNCGNARTLDGYETVKVCGTKNLSALQRRFKCSRCGAREAKLIVLSWPVSRG